MIIRIRRGGGRQPKQRYECFDCHEMWKVGLGSMYAYTQVCPYCHSNDVVAVS